MATDNVLAEPIRDQLLEAMTRITKILKRAPRFLLRITLNGCAAFLYYMLFILAVLTAFWIWNQF
ncbi:MAG: hypothetical protein OXH22_06160 [Chloroflexi bacterium]|nr:hypothetical protein [Chloroflexota bacterium]